MKACLPFIVFILFSDRDGISRGQSLVCLGRSGFGEVLTERQSEDGQGFELLFMNRL